MQRHSHWQNYVRGTSEAVGSGKSSRSFLDPNRDSINNPRFQLRSKKEAKEFLTHSVLGPRYSCDCSAGRQQGDELGR